MPGFNRTGPEGKGSQTGRKLGKCNPKNQKNDEQTASEDKLIERGQGRGLGRRRGSRLGFGPTK